MVAQSDDLSDTLEYEDSNKELVEKFKPGIHPLWLVVVLHGHRQHVQHDHYHYAGVKVPATHQLEEELLEGKLKNITKLFKLYSMIANYNSNSRPVIRSVVSICWFVMSCPKAKHFQPISLICCIHLETPMCGISRLFGRIMGIGFIFLQFSPYFPMLVLDF
jgi:hypothetical protein